MVVRQSWILAKRLRNLSRILLIYITLKIERMLVRIDFETARSRAWTLFWIRPNDNMGTSQYCVFSV